MKKQYLLGGLLVAAMLMSCKPTDTSATSQNSLPESQQTTESVTPTSQGGSEQDSKSQGTNPVSSASSNSGQSESSHSTISITPDSRWNLDFTKYGISFRDQLANLIIGKTTNTTTYKGCMNIGAAAAEVKGTGKFVPFYHDKNTLTTTGACNKEHTWPNSRGGGDKCGGDNVEKDPFMIRPTLTDDNSARGNNFYGLSTDSSCWDPASCGFEGARGESARVILFVATKYGSSNNLSLSNNPGVAASSKQMGRLDRIMQWNKKYPVTDIEKQINNYLDSQGFGRNPFVDHPEYADWIWTETGYATKAPDGSHISTSTGGNSNTSSVETTYNYELVTDIDSVGNKEVVFVSKYSESGANYSAMANSYKGESIPWYMALRDTQVKSDMSKMYCPSEDVARFKITKSNNTYTFYENYNREYLKSYISKVGTHYSIAIKLNDNNQDESFDNNWTVTKSGNGFIMQGSTSGVYLYLSSGDSFSGGNRAPAVPIYMYTAI